MDRYDADGDFIMYTEDDPNPDYLIYQETMGQNPVYEETIGEDLSDEQCAHYFRMYGLDPYEYFDGPVETCDEDEE